MTFVEALTVFQLAEPSSPLYDKIKQGAVDATAKVQAFNRSLSPDGTLVGEYKTGILNAFKNLGLTDIIQKQKSDINNALSQIIAKNKELVVAYRQTAAEGGQAFAKVDSELKQNLETQQKLESNLKQINETLGQTNSIGLQVTNGISNGFKNLKTSLGQFVLGYVGFQAAISATRSIIHQNEELSDSIGNLQIYLKGSKEDALTLVESLKKLDTRTSLAGLVDIGTIVAKKGVAKEEIAGVTHAIDNLMVTLGKEIGDPHEAIASLVKLVNVYSDDKHVTANNIDKIGGAIAKLTQSGVATGPWLIEFAESMAGIRGVTGITIDTVLGLGAGLEELAQKSSVSSSALSQVMVKMHTNADAVAASIGMTTGNFKEMLKNNPLETLVAVAKKLVGNKDLAAMDDFFGSMKDFGKQGKGIVGVLGSRYSLLS